MRQISVYSNFTISNLWDKDFKIVMEEWKSWTVQTFHRIRFWLSPWVKLTSSRCPRSENFKNFVPKLVASYRLNARAFGEVLADGFKKHRYPCLVLFLSLGLRCFKRQRRTQKLGVRLLMSSDGQKITKLQKTTERVGTYTYRWLIV